MKNKNIDFLLFAGFTSNLFYSISYPIIHTILIKGINSNFMSFVSLLSCVLAIIVNKIWLKYSDKLYKHFGKMLFLEGIFYGSLVLLFITKNIDVWRYYLIDALLYSSITLNIICGGTRLKAIRYKDKNREEFDNKNNLLCNLSCIFGYGFGALTKLNINFAFILMFIGTIVDNLFYYIIYKKENKNYS